MGKLKQIKSNSLQLQLSSESLQPLRLNRSMMILLCKNPHKWNNSVRTWTRSMSHPSLKLKLMNQKTERKSQEHPNNITTDLLNQSMLRTIIFFPLNLSALTLSESIEDILKSVTGARRQRPHQSSGNGITQARSGIDGTITNGTTGDHPREDSPQSDGPGIRDSGITTDGSSNTLEDTGTDSRATSGSDMELLSRSTQLHQEVKRSADLSICLRSLDSQDL